MWTLKNRGRYDRSRLRYPSDITDPEWALIGPLIPRAKPGGNKRTVDVRAVVNGLLYILRSGCQWAAHREFRRGVLPPDARHQRTAAFGGAVVGHTASLS
jgi:transposase